MAQSSQSTVVFSPSSHSTDNTMSEQPWKFLFLNISLSTSNKLIVTGIFYILIGLISIGLEAAALSEEDRKEYNHASHSIVYDYNLFGIYLFTLGLTLLILCRSQVYVLISVFILHFFELIYLIRRVATYSLIITNWDNNCSGSYPPVLYCDGKIRSFLVASLFAISIAICLVIFTMVVIKRACDPQSRLAPQQQQPMPISYFNSAATVTTE